MNRGSPVVEPPVPLAKFGQTRMVALLLPRQVACSVPVVSKVVFAVRSTVPKLTAVMLNGQLGVRACAGDEAAKVAAMASAQYTISAARCMAGAKASGLIDPPRVR